MDMSKNGEYQRSLFEGPCVGEENILFIGYGFSRSIRKDLFVRAFQITPQGAQRGPY
jgi:hypothetical protein